MTNQRKSPPLGDDGDSENKATERDADYASTHDDSPDPLLAWFKLVEKSRRFKQRKRGKYRLGIAP